MYENNTKNNNAPPALRLLAALFFLCLFAPMAVGLNNPDTDTNWQEQIDDVDKIANDKGGSGGENDPILIATPEELAYFAQQVNKGDAITYGSDCVIEPTGGNDGKAGGFINYYFALSADIDLSEHFWTPIGTISKPFNGHFDGRGHCVSGLKVNVNQDGVDAYAGLFGNANVATIQNLGVRLAQAGIRAHATNAFAYAGGIAGKAKNIHNCYVEGPGTVEAYATSINDPNSKLSSYAGGIVGSFLSSLTHCYAMVDVKAEGGAFNYAGGIAGSIRHSASLSYTYATGAVEAAGNTANNYAGGICGFAYTGSSLLNNLALNKSIKGNGGESNRIVGNKESEVTLTSNYASPEIQVNGKFVDAGDDMNGDPGVNLGNFGTVIKWGDSWDLDPTRLPQLKMRKDDIPTYDDWPTGEGFTPQPSLDATRYLIADGFAGGKGDSDNPYQITNRAELAYLAKQVNSGTNYSGEYFTLANDIDMNVSPYFWTPIGIDFNKNSFQGHFDGRGYRVKGLKVSGVQHAGLFGSIQGGTVQNLGVEVAAEGITAIDTGNSGNARAGGIAGELYYGTIRNCYVTGDGMVLTSSDRLNSAGGIVGYPNNNSIITHCYATINVKATVDNGDAGGIAGLLFQSTISYTYSTGAIETTNRAGGICGYAYEGSSLSNNLALNSSITGNGDYCHRVAESLESSTATNNYASTKTTCSFTPVDDLNGLDGANTYLNSFVADLKNAFGGDGNKGWEDFSAGTNLPQLKMYKQDDTGYETWNPTSNQPSLKAENYLLAFPKLHIVSPTGGTLTVTDKDGNELPDGSEIPPGTLLTLAYTEHANYRFSEYLSGSSEGGSLVPLSDNPVTMPATNLWLSASFDYQEPPPPPPAPVYHSVYLPQVEGATTDPGPGEYEVESWNTFRFYLTLDSAYSESQPIVTTSRGETLVPRTSDGAYLVKYVRSDVEVFIDGIVQNPPPVANEAIAPADALAPQIWAEGSMLCIRMAEALPATPIAIYTIDGRQHDRFASTPGLIRRQLPTGMYIVRVGDTVRKVVVR